LEKKKTHIKIRIKTAPFWLKLRFSTLTKTEIDSARESYSSSSPLEDILPLLPESMRESIRDRKKEQKKKKKKKKKKERKKERKEKKRKGKT
jgi:hypothetical protein